MPWPPRPSVRPFVRPPPRAGAGRRAPLSRAGAASGAVLLGGGPLGPGSLGLEEARRRPWAGVCCSRRSCASPPAAAAPVRGFRVSSTVLGQMGGPRCRFPSPRGGRLCSLAAVGLACGAWTLLQDGQGRAGRGGWGEKRGLGSCERPRLERTLIGSSRPFPRPRTPTQPYFPLATPEILPAGRVRHFCLAPCGCSGRLLPPQDSPAAPPFSLSGAQDLADQLALEGSGSLI